MGVFDPEFGELAFERDVHRKTSISSKRFLEINSLPFACCLLVLIKRLCGKVGTLSG